jgi:hypothetical protein
VGDRKKLILRGVLGPELGMSFMTGSAWKGSCSASIVLSLYSRIEQELTNHPTGELA